MLEGEGGGSRMPGNYLMGTRYHFGVGKYFANTHRNKDREDRTQILMLVPGRWHFGMIPGRVRYETFSSQIRRRVKMPVIWALKIQEVWSLVLNKEKSWSSDTSICD